MLLYKLVFCGYDCHCTFDVDIRKNKLNKLIYRSFIVVFWMEMDKHVTNSHPLMSSVVSPDYPDLIPEKPERALRNIDQNNAYNPTIHSTLEASVESLNSQTDIAYLGYNEDLPDFPDSPSALRKSLKFDLPVEVSHHDISDNENEKSVYEAHLSENFQNVSLTMNEREGNLNFLSQNKKSNKLRRIKVVHKETSDGSEVSSIDSNNDSLKSEDVFNGYLNDIEDLETDDDYQITEPIEPLSAADERRHARYWQRMVLPDGEQRTIDMRVIEPYKCVLSHGGYLRAGGHTAIVIFSACHLPSDSRIDYEYVMDNLFLYVLWTLERLVTDDYVLVYLHGGATKVPAFRWIKRCYQMVGRKLKKNLIHLYLVHPSLWIKTMLFMTKPFISSKFYRKITYANNLRELMARVPLEGAAIPDKVKMHDALRMK